MSVFRTQYSGLDRALHRFAFRGIGLQKMMAELEDDMFARRLAGIEVIAPVFVTSLPRAGTTLLLNLLSRLPGVATHSYRNMPLLLCPLLWDKLSRSFRQKATLQERAHGDGMAVGFDSPEAFEEVIWKAFWGGKYGERSIALWSANDRAAEFEDFFRLHIRKILHLKLAEGAASGRYVSKNNANIARLPLLPEIFPDAHIVVPFRNPLDHVGSLLRQQRNFLELHAEDVFAAEYMASIGHHDFGTILKPLDFDGWVTGDPQVDPRQDAEKPDFWLRYWIAAFRSVLAHRGPQVILVDYDTLCRQAEPTVRTLLQRLELDGERPEEVSELAALFRPPTRYADEDLAVEAGLLEEARGLHQALSAASINPGGP